MWQTGGVLDWCSSCLFVMKELKLSDLKQEGPMSTNVMWSLIHVQIHDFYPGSWWLNPIEWMKFVKISSVQHPSGEPHNMMLWSFKRSSQTWHRTATLVPLCHYPGYQRYQNQTIILYWIVLKTSNKEDQQENQVHTECQRVRALDYHSAVYSLRRAQYTLMASNRFLHTVTLVMPRTWVGVIFWQIQAEDLNTFF